MIVMLILAVGRVFVLATAHTFEQRCWLSEILCTLLPSFVSEFVSPICLYSETWTYALLYRKFEW
jgi:hypothetical protein